LLKDVHEGRIKEKKQSGRPRCRTLDCMMKRYGFQNLKAMAQCRRAWRYQQGDHLTRKPGNLIAVREKSRQGKDA